MFARPQVRTVEALAPSLAHAPSARCRPEGPAPAPPRFGHSFARVQVTTRAPRRIQTKPASGEQADEREQEADQVAEQVVDQPEPGESATPDGETTPDSQTPGGLIVEDDAADLTPEQMRKSDFLDELREAVCDAANSELAAAGRTAEGCPYVEYWLDFYRRQESQHVERAIRRYAPETAAVASAPDYIPIISDRVSKAAAVWAKTGQITGVPEGVPVTVPEPGTTEGAGSESPRVQFKTVDGGAGHAANPAAVQARLGPGSALDGGVASRMSSAFGHDFSRVRVHADSTAAELSSRHNARAFTIGSDVAFAAGEYRPGTPVGDALIAHELAHVVQQRGAGPVAPGGETEYSALEEDADRSAVSAALSLWGGVAGAFANISRNALPSLKSGLRLSRCSCKDEGGLEWKPFCIQKGPGTFQTDVKSDLDKIYATSQGKGVVDEVIKDRGNSLIDLRYMSGSAGWTGTYIHYDPAHTRKDDCPSPTGWETSPRHVFLFHEVVHTHLYYVQGKGTDPDRECMVTGLGKYFTQMPYNENRLRCELKLPIRPCYGKECTSFPPPSCG